MADGMIIVDDGSTKICARCKQSFPVTKEHWSFTKADHRIGGVKVSGYCKECMRAYARQRGHTKRPPRPLVERTCLQCGVLFMGRVHVRWCSAKCRYLRRRAKARQHVACQSCGNVYIGDPRYSGMCKPCSAKKAAAAAKAKHLADYEARHGHVSATEFGWHCSTRLFTPLYVVECESSGERSLTRHRGAKCHCDVCKKNRSKYDPAKRRAAYLRHQSKVRGPIRIEDVFCFKCGALAGERLKGAGSGSGGRRLVCASCRASAVSAARRARGSQSHSSRARRYGVKRERVDRIKVFQRDGWRCQSCGCDTPMELNGTLHDSAPELDHVVPLSRGGGHTYQNTQCLCRLCNILKGALTMDEWRQAASHGPTVGEKSQAYL